MPPSGASRNRTLAIPAANDLLGEVEHPFPEKSSGGVGEGVAVSGGGDVAVAGGASIDAGKVKDTLSTAS